MPAGRTEEVSSVRNARSKTENVSRKIVNFSLENENLLKHFPIGAMSCRLIANIRIESNVSPTSVRRPVVYNWRE